MVKSKLQYSGSSQSSEGKVPVFFHLRHIICFTFCCYVYSWYLHCYFISSSLSLCSTITLKHFFLFTYTWRGRPSRHVRPPRLSEQECVATSEMGSMPVITMQEHMTIMREIIHTLVQKPSAEPKNLSLPRFNPEIAGSDSATWCAVVNLIMK